MMDDWAGGATDEWCTDTDWGNCSIDTDLIAMVSDKAPSYADVVQHETISDVTVGNNADIMTVIKADVCHTPNIDMTIDKMKTMNMDDIDDNEGESVPGCVLAEELHIEDSELPSILHETSESRVCVEELMSYFINVIDEPVEIGKDFKHEQRLLKEYSVREGVDVQVLTEEQ